MYQNQFPVIDLPATGANIRRLRQIRGLPTVDNLYALSALLGVPMNDILVAADLPNICTMSGGPEPAAHPFNSRARWAWWNFKTA